MFTHCLVPVVAVHSHLSAVPFSLDAIMRGSSFQQHLFSLFPASFSFAPSLVPTGVCLVSFSPLYTISCQSHLFSCQFSHVDFLEPPFSLLTSNLKFNPIIITLQHHRAERMLEINMRGQGGYPSVEGCC